MNQQNFLFLDDWDLISQRFQRISNIWDQKKKRTASSFHCYLTAAGPDWVLTHYRWTGSQLQALMSTWNFPGFILRQLCFNGLNLYVQTWKWGIKQLKHTFLDVKNDFTLFNNTSIWTNESETLKQVNCRHFLGDKCSIRLLMRSERTRDHTGKQLESYINMCTSAYFSWSN